MSDDIDEIILKTFVNGTQWSLEQELNERTGTPDWRSIVDELTKHHLSFQGNSTWRIKDATDMGILIQCVEFYGKALEKAVLEIHELNERLYDLHDFIALDPEFFEEFHERHSAYLESNKGSE